MKEQRNKTEERKEGGRREGARTRVSIDRYRNIEERILTGSWKFVVPSGRKWNQCEVNWVKGREIFKQEGKALRMIQHVPSKKCVFFPISQSKWITISHSPFFQSPYGGNHPFLQNKHHNGDQQKKKRILRFPKHFQDFPC